MQRIESGGCDEGVFLVPRFVAGGGRRKAPPRHGAGDRDTPAYRERKLADVRRCAQPTSPGLRRRADAKCASRTDARRALARPPGILDSYTRRWIYFIMLRGTTIGRPVSVALADKPRRYPEESIPCVSSLASVSLRSASPSRNRRSRKANRSRSSDWSSCPGPARR